MVSPPQINSNGNLHALVESRTGLIMNVHQRSDVLALLDHLTTSSELSQGGDVLGPLTDYPLTHPVWQRIIQLITVGETYFFRSQDQFDALRTHILPALIEERRSLGTRHLRMWSAGCATGEEPYSLAMLLYDLLPDREQWSLSILATDIDQHSLARARCGVYRSGSFRSETPEAIRDRWFTPTREGFLLDRRIRDMVIFAQLNLVSEDYPSFDTGTMCMDMIICRNVTIYFCQDTTHKVVRRFHEALRTDGWLIVGHSEPMASLYEGLTARNFENAVFYQKSAPESVKPVSLALSGAPQSAIPPRVVEPPVRTRAPKPSPMPPGPPVSKPVKPTTPATPAAREKEDAGLEDLLQRAKQAADREQWDDALAWLDKAEKQNAFDPAVHYLRALVRLHSENIEDGVASLRRSIYCDSGFVMAHYLLGDLHARRGQHQAAARHWRMAWNAVVSLPRDGPVPYGDDMTVEMLLALLDHRMKGSLRMVSRGG